MTVSGREAEEAATPRTKFREPWFLSNDNDDQTWRLASQAEFGLAVQGTIERALVWEYGFYDSHPDGNWADEAKPQTDPVIWWYVFGLPHKTAESAAHTGSKSVWGQAVIVRRRKGSTVWEHVTSPVAPTETTEETD